MKSTGIVRRIDDLGRIVIPKEIRKTQHIREGDALEIFAAADGEVVFKKYSPLGGLGQLAGDYAAVLAKSLGCAVVVCDRGSIIAAAGLLSAAGGCCGSGAGWAAVPLCTAAPPCSAVEGTAASMPRFHKKLVILLLIYQESSAILSS